ncbi:hypothetical protein A9G00_29520 [Achromobacter xylosoxidans]|nr:hypothetical protein A9G00_29520 [Achromobacter xylosoxidans]
MRALIRKLLLRSSLVLPGLLAAQSALAASAFCEARIQLARVGDGIGRDQYQYYRTAVFQVDRAEGARLKALNAQWIDYLKSSGVYREDNGERDGNPHSYFCHIAGLGEDSDEAELRSEYENRIRTLRQNGYPPQIVQWVPATSPSTPRAGSKADAAVKPVCEAEIRQTYGPGNTAGATASIARHARQLSSANLAEARENLRQYESLQAGGTGAGTPMVACLKSAWARRVAQLSGAAAAPVKPAAGAPGATSGGAGPAADTKGLAYGPNQGECLKRGMTSEGYITYTNVCGASVTVGYCNVVPAKGAHDGTVCRPHDSEFSRTGKTYVTQGLGLAPGATHRMAYRYDTQSTFIVACVGGQPLIESFDTTTITTGSKARTACWRFASRKR